MAAEAARADDDGGKKNKSFLSRWSGRRRVTVYLLVIAALLAINFWAGTRATGPEPRLRVPYSPFFLDQVRAGNVTSITSIGSALQGSFKTPLTYGATTKPTRAFGTEIPSFADTTALAQLLERRDVTVNAVPLERKVPVWQTIVIGFGPAILLILLLVWIMRRLSGRSALGGFGRSSARRFEPTATSVTFDDVAGIDEAKSELTEVVDFLREAGKYRALGARIPRGVLLSGPPGTGKTLLARAVAGEADAPFFSMSASEFVEAIAGIGASRVRDLFAKAKESAPAIVFIDELDAIGRARSASGSSFGGGSDEREQTLNQILTEMDGFDSATGVIVMAATNRPDILDSALLRPGRFDRRVTVQAPDRAGRQRILEVHTRSIPLADEVDLGQIAATTPGMVGADLANLVNEAALLAARRGQESVSTADITNAFERILLGAERQIMIGPEDRRRTAYHEAGHALVGMLTVGADPVRKISIVPRGPALGVTFAAPDADRFNFRQEEVEARIRFTLGGRAAEEIVYGEPTTGAESDIQVVTELARHMVGRWGMSETIGMVAVLPSDGAGPLFPGLSSVSQRTQELVDSEVRRIVDENHAAVLELLGRNRDKLDALTESLLENETLDEEAAYAAAGVGRPPRPPDLPAVAVPAAPAT